MTKAKLGASLIIGNIAAAILNTACASGDKDVAQVMRGYTAAVACNVFPARTRVTKVVGQPGSSEYGDLYLVAWLGDYGCAGGSGTTFPQFSVVTKESGDSLIVHPEFLFPELIINEVTKLSAADRVVTIEGVGYGQTDQHNFPTKKLHVVLKYVDADPVEPHFEVVTGTEVVNGKEIKH